MSQLPVNPKDWSVALPASILGLVALIYVLVWSIKQLAPVFKGTSEKPTGLTAQQCLEVRQLIEDMVIKPGELGGLHDLKNKVTRLLWKGEERRREPRDGYKED